MQFISLLGFLFSLIVSTILALAWGSKRRIGTGWSFFFLFFWIIPGIILLLLSPSKKNLPAPLPSTKNFNLAFGIFFSVLASYSIYKAIITPEYMQILREDSAIYNYAISVFFAGSAIFLFTRFKRHERMYNEANGIDLPRREPKEKDEWYFEKKE